MPRARGKRGRRRLSGLSAPIVGGGLSWDQQPGEYEVMHQLFSEVGELDVLAIPFEYEGEEYVNTSIVAIRKKLATARGRLPEESPSKPNVRSMEQASAAYLRATPGPRGYHGLRPHFEEALWEWRHTVYEDVKAIAHGLDLDEAHRLAKRMKESFG